jgi:hypothetical protein
MIIKRKTCDIRSWKKHLFLDISSSNIDTLAPWLYQCVETRSIEVFWLLSQPLPHLVAHHLQFSNVLERISRPSCEPLYATNTFHRKQEIFIYEYPLHWVLLPPKTHKRTLFSVVTPLNLDHHCDYWNQPLNMRMRVCYMDCHEAGLCSYLVIYIENILRPLQLFYFHTDSPSYLGASILYYTYCRTGSGEWKNMPYEFCPKLLAYVFSSPFLLTFMQEFINPVCCVLVLILNCN